MKMFYVYELETKILPINYFWDNVNFNVAFFVCIVINVQLQIVENVIINEYTKISSASFLLQNTPTETKLKYFYEYMNIGINMV